MALVDEPIAFERLGVDDIPCNRDTKVVVMYSFRIAEGLVRWGNLAAVSETSVHWMF